VRPLSSGSSLHVLHLGLGLREVLREDVVELFTTCRHTRSPFSMRSRSASMRA
jgi:hypothetical protein